jgi:hypothetical protein
MSDMLAILDRVAGVARSSGCFGDVRVQDAAIRCGARDAAAEAWYTVQHEAGGWCVSLSTADRWLSESIETDLLHYGDPLEELIEEELVELGGAGPVPPPRHFRADDRSYVFVSRIPQAEGDPNAVAGHVGKWLLAYEAAFRNLGDMSGADEE